MPYSGPGMKELRFLTESDYIEPGSVITVGLLIVPENGHHTYWKGPGIVGVPTLIEWDLPEGFEASPIFWPAPEKVDMVGITANGYLGETILLTEIKVPDRLEEGLFQLNAKVAWMSCATSCNPGVTDLTVQLLYHPHKKIRTNSSVRQRFASIRNTIPPQVPGDWTYSLTEPDKNTIAQTITAPGIDQSCKEGLKFFCDDMQVDSNEATVIHWPDAPLGTFKLEFSRPDFARRNPKFFSGVLKSSKQWPGTESRFVEISIPWPEGTLRNE